MITDKELDKIMPRPWHEWSRLVKIAEAEQDPELKKKRDRQAHEYGVQIGLITPYSVRFYGTWWKFNWGIGWGIIRLDWILKKDSEGWLQCKNLICWKWWYV